MSKGQTSVVVSVEDRATGPIKRINDALAKISSPVKTLGAGMSRLGQTTGLNRVGGALNGIAGAARSTATAVSSVVTPLSILTGATTIAGIATMTTRFGEFAQRLSNTSTLIGVGASQLHQFQNAARLAGVDAGTATSSLAGLQKVLNDSRYGRNNSTVSLLARFGISPDQLRESNGQTVEALKILPRLISIINSAPNAQTAGDLASQFGISPEMLPFLQRYNALMQQARQNSMSDETADLGRRLAESQAKLSQSFERVSRAITVALAPSFTELFDVLSGGIDSKAGQSVLVSIETSIRNLMNTVKEFIKTASDDEGFKSFIAGLRGANWAEIGSDIMKFVRALGRLISVFASVVGSEVGMLAIESMLAIWGGTKVVRAVDGALKFAAAMRAVGAASAVAGGASGAAGLAGLLARIGLGALVTGGAVALGVGALALGVTQLEPARPGQRAISRQIWQERGAMGRQLSSPEQDERADEAIAYLKSKGMSEEQAIGVVANLMHESGMRTNAKGDDGAAGGLAQWRDGRRAAFQAWAGMDVTEADMEKQLDFLLREMQQGSDVTDAFRREFGGVTDPADAAISFSRGYERPADRENEAAARGLTADRIARRRARAAPLRTGSLGGAQFAQNGRVQVDVTLRGAPPGTTVSTRQAGAVNARPPRIEPAFALG